MEMIELEKDHVAFESKLDALLKSNPGKYALLKNEAIVDFYDSYDDAYSAGLKKFGLDQTFYIGKIEKINPQPVSYAWDGGVMFGKQRQKKETGGTASSVKA